MMTARYPRLARMRGAALVELALVLVPMVLLVFGVAEFGRAIYQYDTLVKSVRDAARLLSEHNPSDASYPATTARCLAVYGVTDCTGATTPLVPGLTTDMVVICDRVTSPNSSPSADCTGGTYENVDTGLGSINLVQVRIKGFTFASVVPIIPAMSNLVFNDISSTMRQVL